MAKVVRYDRAYEVTVRRLHEVLRPVLAETIERIVADYPVLPGEGDEAVALAPSQVVWYRRQLPGTAWWVHYSVVPGGVILRSVIIPE